MANFFYPVGALLKNKINDGIDYVASTYADDFEWFTEQILVVLITIEKLLRVTPEWLFLLLLFALSAAVTRRVGLSVLFTGCMYFIGCLGLWDQAMQTIAMTVVSVLLCTIIGLPLGIMSAQSNWCKRVLNPLLNVMQTIPSFVYLIPTIMLLGLGKVPAILSTVIYAVPPLIRLIDLGIRQTNRETIEASRAFGATQWQILTRVQLPLALPSIMQGFNQTLMMALSMVVVASMIGARGLGLTVLTGLQNGDTGTGFLGGIAIVILAIMFDRITQSIAHNTSKKRQVVIS